MVRGSMRHGVARQRGPERAARSGAVHRRRGVGDARHGGVPDGGVCRWPASRRDAARQRTSRRRRGRRMMLTPKELAIARSVIYASLFDYPLTLDQLHQALLEVSASPAEILATYLASDTLPMIVESRDGFFFPAGRGDLVRERLRREA